MSDIRLPPLRLNSPNSLDTPRSNTSSLNGNLSARERRHLKNKQKNIEAETSVLSDNSRRLPHPKNQKTNESEERRAPRRKELKTFDESEGYKNGGYVSDEPTKTEEKIPNQQKRSRKSKSNEGRDDQKSKRRGTKRSRITTSNLAILEGLEEDIIDTVDNETEASKDSNRATDNYVSDTGQKSLIKTNDLYNGTLGNLTRKSMPTDKYYLEKDNKFEVQPKQIYEKRVALKQQTELEAEIKLKQKEEMKYQILTPKISLNTHKFLRIIFLFIHGVNVGTQFWQAVIIYCLNYLNFEDGSTSSVLVFWVYKNLALPFHCLSYFLLTLCIIDIMDRVDFTRMTVNYFVKCITFQNNFWSIIFYAVAFISTLSMIYVDDEIYINYLSTETNSTIIMGKYTRLENSVNVWKSINVVKAAFTLLAWLLFTIFSEHDMTYQSLEKREFSLLDDLVKTDDNTTTTNNNIDKKAIQQQNQTIA